MRPVSTWSRMTVNTAQTSSRPNTAKQASDEEINRGIRGLMEVGQSGRHERAVRAAKREMWESIALSAGIPVSSKETSGRPAEWNLFASGGVEDDEVIIQDDQEWDEQAVSAPVPARASLAAAVPRPMSVANRYANSSMLDAEDLELIHEDQELDLSDLQVQPSRHGGHDRWPPSEALPSVEPSEASRRKDLLESEHSQPPSSMACMSREASSSTSIGSAGSQKRVGGRTPARAAPTAPRHTNKVGDGTLGNYWRSSAPRPMRRPASSSTTRTIQNATVMSSPKNKPPVSVATAPVPSPCPMASSGQPPPPSTDSTGRRDNLMAMMVAGIRSAQPEDEPELTVATRSIELSQRSSQDLSPCAKSRTPRPPDKWVLAAEPSATDIAADPYELSPTEAAAAMPVDLAGLHAAEPGVSRSMEGTPRNTTDGTEAKMSHEFYNLQVTVGTHMPGQDLSDWLFDVVVSEVGGQGRSASAGQGLRVNSKNQVLFKGSASAPLQDPSILNPLDVLPWVTSPEQLFRTTLNIEVWSTHPSCAQVVNTRVWLGPWGEEQPPGSPQQQPANLIWNSNKGESLETTSSAAAGTGVESAADTTALKLDHLPTLNEEDAEGASIGSTPRTDKRLSKKLSGMEQAVRPLSPKLSPWIGNSPLQRSRISSAHLVVDRKGQRRPMSAGGDQQTHRGTKSTRALKPGELEDPEEDPAFMDAVANRDELVDRLRSLSAVQELHAAKVGAVQS
eukprot:CAMPEP_0117696996 /NCGR_PEP_ID=MMETSP0804-20121206/28984_1 /TAXON_ID=1074897 /ORGANISM="Tetraselmis astigmatica, Strain CCMP880" /LENGTH=733 /DNA_ID=CAMNT_0005511199 /DNA_START=110 /DNA_END=2313 /DNA_ORIENTATION=+